MRSSARSRDPALPFAGALLLASAATAGVGLWLGTVIAFVLPVRDPAHIPMWRAIAAGCLAYSALTWVCLARGARPALLRAVLLAASVLAVGAGSYGAVAMILRGIHGGDFEGYVVLMGFVLSSHGVSGWLYSRRAGRNPTDPSR